MNNIDEKFKTLEEDFAIKDYEGIKDKVLRAIFKSKAQKEGISVKEYENNFKEELKKQVLSDEELREKYLNLKDEDEKIVEDKDIFEKELDDKKELNEDENKESKKQVEDNLENIENDSDTNKNKKQELLLIVSTYKKVYEEYLNLRIRVDEQIVKGQKLDLDDNMYNKYLLYQNYLQKLDERHLKLTGKYIAKNDKDIAKMEQDFSKTLEKSNIKKERQKEIYLKQIEDSKEQIDKINEQIIILKERFENESISTMEYNAVMEVLQNDLILKNHELESIEPSIYELYENEQIQDDFNKYVDKKSYTYEKSKAKNVYGSSKILEKKSDYLNDINDEKIEDTIVNSNISDKELIDDMLNRAQEQIDKGNYTKAREYIDSAKKISNIQIDTKQEQTKVVENKDDVILSENEENIESNISNDNQDRSNINDSRSSFFKEELSRVEDKEDVMQNEINRLRKYSDELAKNDSKEEVSKNMNSRQR